MTFIKKIYIIITKSFYYKKYISIYIVKKTQKIIFMKKKSEKEIGEWEESEEWKRNGG